jgi:hypothetical protein
MSPPPPWTKKAMSRPWIGGIRTTPPSPEGLLAVIEVQYQWDFTLHDYNRMSIQYDFFDP